MPQFSLPKLSLLSLQLSPLPLFILLSHHLFSPSHPLFSPSHPLHSHHLCSPSRPLILSPTPSSLHLSSFQLNKAVLKMSERCKCLEEELTETKVLYRKEFQQRKLLHNEVCVCAYACMHLHACSCTVNGYTLTYVL